jgi:hypothetical protein
VVFIGGGDVDFDGRIRPAMHHNTSRASMVVRDFRRYYPMLRTVKITHDWAGPIDRTINGLPIFGRLYEDANIYYGVGWSDSGVGPSVVGGKILASLALGRHDEWSGCGLITGSASSFPPEPIRFLGAHIVREAILRKEDAEALEKRPPRLAVALSKLAPTGLEDKQNKRGEVGDHGRSGSGCPSSRVRRSVSVRASTGHHPVTDVTAVQPALTYPTLLGDLSGFGRRLIASRA